MRSRGLGSMTGMEFYTAGTMNLVQPVDACGAERV